MAMPRISVRRLIIVALAMVAGIWGVAHFHAGALYVAKASALRSLNRLPASERIKLSSVPRKVLLPPARGNGLERVTCGGYTVRLPVSDSRNDLFQAVTLTYPRFSVTIMPPVSLAAYDAAAQQLHFDNFFDRERAVHFARPEEIGSLADLDSVKRTVLLLSDKRSRQGTTVEQFHGGDLSGFITVLDTSSRQIVAELTTSHGHIGCGVRFFADEGMTLGDVEQFLADLKLEQNQPATKPKL